MITDLQSELDQAKIACRILQAANDRLSDRIALLERRIEKLVSFLVISRKFTFSTSPVESKSSLSCDQRAIHRVADHSLLKNRRIIDITFILHCTSFE